MSSQERLIGMIAEYYRQAEVAYSNWGKDTEREGIYALHCGYEEEGVETGHWESIKRLTQEVITFAQLEPKAYVLDAGCGTGAVSFELKSMHEDAIVIGINVALNQLQTAVHFSREANVEGVNFSLQDYLQTALPSDTFTNILFVESIAHANSKEVAVQEATRLLKSEGVLTIADIFIVREPENEEEQEWLSDLAVGWHLPDINNINTFLEQLQEAGCQVATTRDITANVIASTLRMRLNAERRIEEETENPTTETIHWSRKAVIASHKVLEAGLVGYLLINARKRQQNTS